MAKNIQERLRLLRGTMSQQAFAGRLGVAQTTLGRYERGDSQPDLSFIQTLCITLGLNARWLVLGEGPMRRADAGPESQGERRCMSAACENHLYNSNTKLEAELEYERQERRQLQATLLALNEECRAVLRENANLREEVARMQERLRFGGDEKN